MQILLLDPSTKSCVDASYQSTTVSDSHLEVGVKKMHGPGQPKSFTHTEHRACAVG